MDKNNLAPIDLNLFKVFSMVYTLRNLTHAGVQLAMTQPAVSRALTRLNHIFREQLFQRIDGEMRPTPAAERLAPLVFEALAKLGSAVAATRVLDPTSLTTTFRIGGNDYVSAIVLAGLITSVATIAPRSLISMIHCTHLNVSTLLHRNEIDCAIISRRPADESLAAKLLFDDDFVVMSCAEHPVVRYGMTLERYLDADHVLVSHAGKRDGWVDERLTELDRERRVIAVVHLFSAVPRIVAARNALCTLPRRMALRFAQEHQLHLSETPFPKQVSQFYLVWSPHQYVSLTDQWFRDQIQLVCTALC
jgi:DNA-binding transcriptional LysR family regulator